MSVKDYIKNPYRIFYRFNYTKLSRLIPDKAFSKLMFRAKIGKKLNLKNPQTFNEKLQWLKLYDRNPLYSNLVDKFEVKKYVETLIGKEHLIPLYGVYDSFDEIRFDELPNEFVMKCTHDSGSVILCKDKTNFNIENARAKINKSLRYNFYYREREWPYKNVKPRIIVEKYLSNGLTDLPDYKLFCFNGKVKIIKIDCNRFTNHQAFYFDEFGKLLPFSLRNYYPDFDHAPVLPDCTGHMKQLAEILASELPFVRVDFFEVNGQIYFGELTLYPSSGFGKFSPDEWDEKIGSYLVLPQK